MCINFQKLFRIILCSFSYHEAYVGISNYQRLHTKQEWKPRIKSTLYEYKDYISSLYSSPMTCHH
jgi:hypothetical protein